MADPASHAERLESCLALLSPAPAQQAQSEETGAQEENAGRQGRGGGVETVNEIVTLQSDGVPGLEVEVQATNETIPASKRKNRPRVSTLERLFSGSYVTPGNTGASLMEKCLRLIHYYIIESKTVAKEFVQKAMRK